MFILDLGEECQVSCLLSMEPKTEISGGSFLVGLNTLVPIIEVLLYRIMYLKKKLIIHTWSRNPIRQTSFMKFRTLFGIKSGTLYDSFWGFDGT